MRETSQPRVAAHMSAISPSPLVAVGRRVAELRAGGAKILALEVGEPDFPTPDYVKIAAIKAIVDDRSRYTPADGVDELKQAVANKLLTTRGLRYETAEIAAVNGSKQGIFSALSGLLDPGDEVIIVAPFWMSYPDMVLLAGGKPVVVETSAERGYKLDPQSLAAALGPRTRCLILNSPSNPAGAVYSVDELRGLAEVMRAHPRLFLISDDVYEDIHFLDAMPPNMVQAAPDLRDRVAIVSAVSKSFSMTGWRLGYVAAPRDVLAAIRTCASQATNHPSSISQWAAVAALRGPCDALLASRRATFLKRRNIVVSAIRNIDGLDLKPPDGAFYAFIDCRPLLKEIARRKHAIGTDVALASYLLENAHLSLMAGSYFGSPGHLRLSFAASEETLSLALGVFDHAVTALRTTR
jgi:aspartate aminotransferase